MSLRVLFVSAMLLLPRASFAWDSEAISEVTRQVENACKSLPKEASSAQQTVCVELAKDSTEKDKLELDKGKRSREFLVSLVQVGAAVIAVGVPVWLAFLGNRNDRKARIENEKLQFQLKAAEIAMDARDSTEVKSKADLLVALFPDRLPKDFTSKLDPMRLSFGPGREMRLELLKLMAGYPEQREVILKIWSLMWPGDASPDWKPPKEGRYLWLPSLMKDPVVGKNELKA